MEALEQPEDTLGVSGRKTDAVVGNADQPLAVPAIRANLHLRRYAVAAILEGVRKQVLESLRELNLFARDD